jgi:protease II
MIPLLFSIIDPYFFIGEISVFILLAICFIRIFYLQHSKRESEKLLCYIRKRFSRPSFYPESRVFEEQKSNNVKLFDVTVAEPFKKLERDSEKRREWLVRQRTCYLEYMEQLKFQRSQLKSRLRKFQKYEAFETPFQVHNSRYFYFKKSRRDQQHYVLFTTINVRHKGLVLLDPNIEFGDKSSDTTVIGTWISNDAVLLCYAFLQTLDRDSEIIIKVRDIASGNDALIDTLTLPAASEDTGYGSLLSLFWMHKKNRGFFYTRWRCSAGRLQLGKGLELG